MSKYIYFVLHAYLKILSTKNKYINKIKQMNFIELMPFTKQLDHYKLPRFIEFSRGIVFLACQC